MLFGEDRSDMREVFFTAWEKFHRGDALEPAEQLVIDVLHRHPEYHRIVGNRDHADQDWTPEMGQTNPFLHMGMHIALAEQVGMDRPAGVRQAYEQLAAGMGDTHAAEHEMMECLGRTLWEAQQAGGQPDEAGYLECVQRLAQEKGGRVDD
ncbi:MAG: DUF1841 family protein [Thiohalorhabdaceae bacterium]